VHFQLAMLAYNLNCWLMLWQREEQAQVEDLRHTTLATARLRFLFLAAKIVRHAGPVMVRYSDHYAKQGTRTRRMDRRRDGTAQSSLRARTGVGTAALNDPRA
jgi:hypothetical protein